mmetsp:Transcript_23146/g.34275  ORF Transcript_23146/g.34275 Transcript_23146/m.34275 type:complete len:250 (+) Transcript_23146:4432-5181(+)
MAGDRAGVSAALTPSFFFASLLTWSLIALCTAGRFECLNTSSKYKDLTETGSAAAVSSSDSSLSSSSSSSSSSSFLAFIYSFLCSSIISIPLSTFFCSLFHLSVSLAKQNAKMGPTIFTTVLPISLSLVSSDMAGPLPENLETALALELASMSKVLELAAPPTFAIPTFASSSSSSSNSYSSSKSNSTFCFLLLFFGLAPVEVEALLSCWEAICSSIVSAVLLSASLSISTIDIPGLRLTFPVGTFCSG